MSGDFGLWGGTVGPGLSARVWPLSGTPLLSFACLRPSHRPEPQPTAEPEHPAPPRSSVARTLTRHPARMESPPHCHRLPSAFPATLQARPHLPATKPLEPRPISHTSLSFPAPPRCPPVRASLRLLRPTHTAGPPLTQICPSLTHVPGMASPPPPCFCRGPAPVACRSFFRPGPRQPHASPFPPALRADAPPKHPWACLPAPGSPPPPLPAIVLPHSLIHVGRPPTMAPSAFGPHSQPCTLAPKAPAGASRKPPAATASTRRATGDPLPQGNRLCPIAPECAALAARWCASSAVHFPSPRRTRSLNRRDILC